MVRFLVALVAIAVALGAGAASAAPESASGTLELVVVPRLIGRSLGEARALLRQAGLTIEVVGPTRDETQVVIDQDPPAGTRVPSHRQVRVRVERATAAPTRPRAPAVEPRVELPRGPAHPPASRTPRMERSLPATVSRPQPAPPTPESSSDLAAIDRVLERLELASVAFNVPATLRLRQIADIQLLLSTRESMEDLQSALTAAGARAGARVRIAREMEAHLTGTGFKIEAVTPEVQAVSGVERTEWKWQIEPTQTGPQTLHLTLSAHLEVNGERVPRVIRTFERDIAVNVTWSDRARLFLAGNWQWLWAAILVPVAGWVARRWQKSRTPPAA